MRELPRYQCYKQVWALKIKELRPIGNGENHKYGAFMLPEEPHYAPLELDQAFIDKHKPEVGGYYVVYEDGYKSYSPASAFENGYFPCNGYFTQTQPGTHGPKRAFFTLQDGPIKEVGRNGVQIDEVIEFAKTTIEGFNKAFPCRENSLVITKLDEALLWLMKRRLDREARMVEGRNAA